MTTYILCGGSDRENENFGKNLVKVITGIVEKPRILDVFFSLPDDQRQDFFDSWTSFYKKYFSQVERQNAETENFYEQIARSDVIFFHGGYTVELLKNVSEFHNLKEAFRGKIVVGSSAGANFLAKHSLRRKNDDVTDGLGILPINVVVHYESNNPEHFRSHADTVDLARDFPENPTILLREGEFSIFEEADPA